MSNIDALVNMVEVALTDEVYDGGSGALSEQQLHAYIHTLARTAVEALTAVELEDPEVQPAPNVAVATAGEFAAIWNAATPEHRQNITDVIMARQDEAISCFMEDHDGLKDEVAWLRRHRYIDVVFDRLPDQDGANFIEVEDMKGASIKVGEWWARQDGTVALRISSIPDTEA